MYFPSEDNDLLKKYNSISGKVRADIKKGFDSEPVQKNFLKTKIKFFDIEATDFHDKEILKVDSNLTCLAVISLDSALNKNGYYYPQVFLNKWKYIKKKKNDEAYYKRRRFFSDSDESDT